MAKARVKRPQARAERKKKKNGLKKKKKSREHLPKGKL